MTAVRSALTLLLLLTSAIVASTVLAPLGLPGATPDPVLLVVVALALRWGPTGGAVVGFAGGLIVDLVPPAAGSAGRWAGVFVVIGYLVGRVFEDAEESPLTALVAVTAAAVASVLGSAGLGFLFGDPAVVWGRVPDLCVSAVLYDVVLTPVIVPVAIFLARRTQAEADFL